MPAAIFTFASVSLALCLSQPLPRSCVSFPTATAHGAENVTRLQLGKFRSWCGWLAVGWRRAGPLTQRWPPSSPAQVFGWLGFENIAVLKSINQSVRPSGRPATNHAAPPPPPPLGTAQLLRDKVSTTDKLVVSLPCQAFVWLVCLSVYLSTPCVRGAGCRMLFLTFLGLPALHCVHVTHTQTHTHSIMCRDEILKHAHPHTHV
jgi:hypothetical protein